MNGIPKVGDKILVSDDDYLDPEFRYAKVVAIRDGKIVGVPWRWYHSVQKGIKEIFRRANDQ